MFIKQDGFYNSTTVSIKLSGIKQNLALAFLYVVIFDGNANFSIENVQPASILPLLEFKTFYQKIV